MCKYKIGILAYGSLIDEPGAEIKPIITNRIKCKTPFKVEYARKSSTRGDGPTLIPSDGIGKEVNAEILVLKDVDDLCLVKSMLWRRETRKIGLTETYVHSKTPTRNKVQILELTNFNDTETVLFTKIGSNINKPITPDLLADLAIASILTKAGDDKKDGIRYLLKNKNNGIVTELSNKYENLILKKTGTQSLEQAIVKMDAKRTK